MTPIRLFDAFLTPPTARLSVPKLGALGTAELVALVGGMLLGMLGGGRLLGGVGWILGALGGPLLVVMVLRRQVDGQPILRVAVALGALAWLRRTQPAALTIDLAPLCALGAVGRGPALVTDADGRAAQIEWSGRSS